jgi:hypothetical protein
VGGGNDFDAGPACVEAAPETFIWYDTSPPLEGPDYLKTAKFTGTVVHADVKSIVIDSCETDAGCAPALHTLTPTLASPFKPVPPELTLSIPDGTRVSVDIMVGSAASDRCSGTVRWLVIADAPDAIGDDAGTVGDPWLVLSVDPCVAPRSMSSAYEVASVDTACETNLCGRPIPKKAKFSPGSGWTGSELELAQGDVSPWTISHGDRTRSLLVRNLVSYQTGRSGDGICSDATGSWGYWLSRTGP